MTDKDRPPLPKRAWLTPEELARRWGCTVEDLIDYGENATLRISVRPARPVETYRRENDANGNPVDHWGEAVGSIGLTPEALRGAFGDGCKLSVVLPPVLIEDAPFSYVAPPLDGPLQIFTRKDLVIVTEEIDRFEREYRIGAHAGEPPKPKPELGERERQTLLILIGALTETLMDKGPFKSQAALVGYLEEEYGLTKRTTDGKLAEANRALQSR